MASVSGKRPLRERRSVLVLLLPVIPLLITSVCPMASAQADSCSKPRVAVQLTEIHDEVFELLDSKGVPLPKESWILQIQAKVLEELRMGSPGTEFVSVDGVGAALPTDCDYRFQYLLTLTGAGEDIEVAGLLHSEYTAYYMQSKLAQNNPCGGSDWLLDVEITKEDEDVFATIEHNIEAWGDIGRRIEDFEASHLVPPRGPELHHSQDREYVSPLEGERSLDIKIDVTNCKGEPVYRVNPGQRVVLPKETERGEIRPTRGFPQNMLDTGKFIVLIIVRPQGASATYTLKRGMEPRVETVEMTTCGVDAKLVEETEIHIHGIEIEVSPRKTVVCEGDSTTVEVKLSKVDTEGNKEPIAGQKVKVEVSGLVDGDVSPLGEAVTDQDGKVVLSYRAGAQDSTVTFKAEFQPPGYPDSVRDQAVVRGCQAGWNGTATLKQTHQFDCEDTVQEGRTVKKLQQHDNRSERATMSVRCEDFDLAESPIVALSGGTDIVVSGNHQRSVDESHLSESTWNACWGNDLITLEGSGSCALAPNSLSLTFRKAGMASADEMRRLMQEMSETITDNPDRYRELSAQLDALMNPGSGGGSTPLKGVVQYAVDCPFAADYRKLSKHQCESDTGVKVSDQGTTLDMRGFALTVEFEATYVKGENGEDRIEASYPKTTPHSPHSPFTGVGPHDCPPMIETFNFELNLQRQPSE